LRKLKRIYRDYLKKIGKLDGELRLGRRGDSRGVEYEEVLIHESELLRQRLDNRFQSNNKIIILAIVLLCILFFIGVYLVFYYRDEPLIMGGIFSGTFVLLLSIVKWLHILWKEKSVMDLSLVIFEDLSPKEAAEKAAEFIPLLYKKICKPSRSKMRVKIGTVEKEVKVAERIEN
jgi:hypothetical protein